MSICYSIYLVSCSAVAAFCGKLEQPRCLNMHQFLYTKKANLFTENCTVYYYQKKDENWKKPSATTKKHAVVKITWQQQPGKFRESHHDDQCCNEQIID